MYIYNDLKVFTIKIYIHLLTMIRIYKHDYSDLNLQACLHDTKFTVMSSHDMFMFTNMFTMINLQ